MENGVADQSECVIDAKSIYKSFGDLHAVADLSLGIRRGETFGLLGPNGAGKSTTISMLMGLMRPDRGTIEICNKSSVDPAIKRRIGLAPQSLSLYSELSAEENLKFFGGLYGLKGKVLAERTEEMLELSQLSDRRRDRVETYSGGMKRRLNIAVAMIHHPEILLLDEPTVGVDPQSRNHILESIQGLSQQGLTVLYTTHYMEEAERLCERIGIMDHGKLLAIGTKEKLYQQHTLGSVVRFRTDQSAAVNRLSDEQSLHCAEMIIDGDQVRFQTQQPAKVLAQLAAHSIEVHQLTVEQPGLEDVFLSLTGRTLRD